MSKSAGRSAIVGVGYSKILRDKGIDGRLFGGTQQRASTMWKRSSVTSADVDVAELYDGFTHIAMAWVEATAQLRGECGQRQVPAAQVAVVANGFGPQTGSCVLTV